MNIYPKIQNDFSQVFLLFSQENWKTESKNYPQSVTSFFSGKKNEIFVFTNQEQTIYLIGLGSQIHIKPFEYQEMGMKLAQDFKNNIAPRTTLLQFNETDFVSKEQFIIGLFLGTYRYSNQKDHPFWNHEFSLQVEHFNEEEIHEILNKSFALYEAQSTCMEWLNKPANLKKTNLVSAFLEVLSKDFGLKYTHFNTQQCEKLGLGAFLAVNRGSEQEGAFTILEYKSSQENAKTIGLVGKCVLFDTGGISIKGSENMHYMKSDMGGATAVIGTLLYASKMSLPINIVALLPITDNAVSEKAYLPSDVITAYNGKTIEVLNTDAEGRMTLADGLSYLSRNYKTDILLDLATLTGSAVRMFGDTCAPVFSNNEDLLERIEKAGKETNQRVWKMPLWDIWNKEFKSDVADMKNIAMKPVGDCIVAAKFLEHFIENHPKWAHLDIAGVALGNVGYAKDKAATGFGVQLLIKLIENIL